MNQEPSSAWADNNSPALKIKTQIISEISSKYNLDLTQDPVAMERIEEAAQTALHELESWNETMIDLPFLSATATGPIHIKMVISREALGKVPLEQDKLDKSPHGDVRTPDTSSKQTRIELPDRKPLITTTLMIVSIIVYVFQIITDFTLGYDLPAALGMKTNELIMQGQYWRLITPMFLHGSFIHLGFNMYALHILGRRVEKLFGNIRFLGLYFVAGITGNVFSFFFTAASSLGSSTAIFGLLGAEAIFIYLHKDLFGVQFRRALSQIIQVAAINIIIGLSPGIDNWGHIGGLIGGAFYTWFGGPQLSILNKPPLIRLKDDSSTKISLIAFVVQILILISLVLGIMNLKY
jgi:rhomboid protease GluP